MKKKILDLTPTNVLVRNGITCMTNTKTFISSVLIMIHLGMTMTMLCIHVMDMT